MKLAEIASFEIDHEGLGWPWLAFAPGGTAVAFAHGSGFETRSLEGRGPVFPRDVPLEGLRGFALHPGGERLAYVVSGALVSCGVAGEPRRTALAPELEPRAITFDGKGRNLWIAAETETETVVLLFDAETLAPLGASRSPAMPRPTTHELYPHPIDDAVLLVAACGEDGTFSRVVGWSGSDVERIETALDEGGVAAGFVGFSRDGARVHLAEADELRTHAWPTLHELSSVPFADEFVSSFSGAVVGDWIYVDGQSADDGDDLVMRFDRSAIRGAVERPPFPRGMWAGRLGRDAIVAVEPKTSRASILRLDLPPAHD